MEKIIFTRIKEVSDLSFKKVWELYTTAFPVFEQRMLKDQELAFTFDACHFDAISNESGKLIGLIQWWGYSEFTYIEHLAIFPHLRGCGYGQKVLNAFHQQATLPVVLEIDPLVGEIERRRLHFYEKLGYKLTSFDHAHPAYNRVGAPLPLLLLSYPNEISQDQYSIFRSIQWKEIIPLNR